MQKKSDNFIWILTDIHGCYEELYRLLNYCEEYPTQKYIFLGDYIDRGPDSRKVINLIKKIKNEKILLMGNHDKMMLDFFKKINKQNYRTYYELWFMNGGEKTLLSYCENLNDLSTKEPMEIIKNIFQKIDNEGHIKFLTSLKFSHQEQIRIKNKKINFIFVHAGLNLYLNIEEQLAINSVDEYDNYIYSKQISPAETIIWIREKFYESELNFLKDNILVHGHTPIHHILANNQQDKFEILNSNCIMPIIKYDNDGRMKTINIDTGCVYGGFLTMLGLNEKYLSEGKILFFQIRKNEKKIYEHILEFDASIYN